MVRIVLNHNSNNYKIAYTLIILSVFNVKVIFTFYKDNAIHLAQQDIK